MTPLTAVLRARLRGVVAIGAVLSLAAVGLAASSGARELTPGEKVIAEAREHLGDTYTWGATGPDTWDCSGFTMTMWREAGGVNIPRVSRQQQAWAVPLPAEQVEPGDLFFFGDPVSHVGLVENRVTSNGKTVIQLLDASSSRKGVVRRMAWTSPTVRYGRVKREGMTPVKPWTPAPLPTPAVAAPPVLTAPAPVKAPAPLKAQTASVPTALKPGAGLLTGLPTTSAPSSAAALKATKLARAALGNRTLGDVALVQNVFRRAAGLSLPGTRSALLAVARRVPVADARLGDLVVYPAPAAHVGIYVGNGLMVDASRSLGSVVLRPVWAATGVTLQRLPA